ncbi:hypothetical protein HBI63_078030 [Parastagonospora nodorum]|nr:hypothetical protein HBI63_078030 [Parastagonospora nodorum]
MASKALDLHAVQHLADAVKTAVLHVKPNADEAMKTAAIDNLTKRVHDLIIATSTIPLVKPNPPVHLDYTARAYVRTMQMLLEDEPADMATQLQDVAIKLHRRITGQGIKYDAGGQWVPDVHAKQQKMTLQELLKAQNDALPHLDQVKDLTTNVPDPDDIAPAEREPDEFDDEDSEDERNLVITAQNYPLTEFSLNAHATPTLNAHAIPTLNAHATPKDDSAEDDENEGLENGQANDHIDVTRPAPPSANEMAWFRSWKEQFQSRLGAQSDFKH